MAWPAPPLRQRDEDALAFVAMSDDPELLQPLIVLIDDDEQACATAERVLRGRYDGDYDIVRIDASRDALERIQALHDEGREIALVLGGHYLADDTLGTDLLGRIGAILPDTRRAVLVDWADTTTYETVRQASALGQIDTFVYRPNTAVDEEFHHAIVELLGGWMRAHGHGFEGVQLIGDPFDEATHLLRDAMQRSTIPFGFYDSASLAGRALLDQADVNGPFPVAITFNGKVVTGARPGDIAAALGVNVVPGDQTFDLAVVGAGPAGLAAAINAASEGMRVIVIEAEALGGQAGSSTLIRNYLGFPRGLSGSELGLRAYFQAFFFGVRFIIGRRATGIRPDGERHALVLDDGNEVRTRRVVIATGVNYRRLGLPALEAFTGRGVFYGGAVTEATAMRDREVFVVGGANSATESALYLAQFARHVTLLVRGSSLAETSEYLRSEVERHPNMSVRLNSSIVDATGDFRLRTITVKDSSTDEMVELKATGVFLHIGAQPRTDWLPDSIERDERGFVRTGTAVTSAAPGHTPMSFETCMPGVYAVGDVRDGSIKRVAAAVGEGSMAIQQVRESLTAADRLVAAER
jgi:thioredoxin reductase (NADPH)